MGLLFLHGLRQYLTLKETCIEIGLRPLWKRSLILMLFLVHVNSLDTDSFPEVVHQKVDVDAVFLRRFPISLGKVEVTDKDIYLENANANWAGRRLMLMLRSIPGGFLQTWAKWI